MAKSEANKKAAEAYHQAFQVVTEFTEMTQVKLDRLIELWNLIPSKGGEERLAFYSEAYDLEHEVLYNCELTENICKAFGDYEASEVYEEKRAESMLEVSHHAYITKSRR